MSYSKRHQSRTPAASSVGPQVVLRAAKKAYSATVLVSDDTLTIHTTGPGEDSTTRYALSDPQGWRQVAILARTADTLFGGVGLQA